MGKIRPERSSQGATLARLRSNALFLGLFALILVGLVIGGIHFYNNQSRLIRERKSNELHAISTLKVDQILSWRQEQLDDARMNVNNAFFGQAVDRWLSNPGDDSLNTDLKNYLKNIVNLENYQNAALVSSDGELLISADPAFTSLDAAASALALLAFESQEIQLGDLFRNPASGEVAIFLAAPIKNGGDSSTVFLLKQIDPNEVLFPLIQTWPVPSQSAESLLIRKEAADILFLNTLRFHDDPPLTIRIPLSQTNVLGVKAALGQSGVLEGEDYRGEAVLGDILPVPGTTWILVTKVNTSEILSEARNLGQTVALFEILAILMTAALAAYAFHSRERGLYQNLYQAETERNAALELTRTTLYSIGDGVITTDPQGLVTRMNPMAEEMTGWSEAEALGKPLKQVFHIINETTRQIVENPVEKVLSQGRVVGLANHTMLISRDGSELFIADSSAPIRDAAGKIIGVVLIFRDQTQERLAQKEQALLNHIITNSLDEIYLFDAETLLYRFLNQGSLKNLGYTLEQMQSKTPLDIKPELSTAVFNDMIQGLIQHEKNIQVYETVHQRLDGSRYPVELHMQLFELAGEKLFLSIGQDITERNFIQKELQESEQRFRAIFENNSEVILLIEPESGAILDANPAASAFYGWTHAELLNLNIDQINTLPPKEVMKEMKLSYSKERNFFTFKHRKKNGEISDVEVFGGLIQLAGENTIFSIIHDITARKQAEVKVAEQMDELRRWYNLTLDRENRILELKAEVNNLLIKTGQPLSYSVVEEGGPHE